MRIVIAGGTGFLGTPLAEVYAEHGHDVRVLTRSLPPAASRHDSGTGIPGVTRVGWNPESGAGGWADVLDGADAVVNLAGESIADKRWTPQRKDALHQSRIVPTRALVDAIHRASRPPRVFISGSGINYYGTTDDGTTDDGTTDDGTTDDGTTDDGTTDDGTTDDGAADDGTTDDGTTDDGTMTEDAPAGNDFLAQLCVAWEGEALAASDATRVVLLRTGIVLERTGGALAKMLLPFRLFAGGPLGSGRQYMSWIHRLDWIEMVRWIVDTELVSGAVNATAPVPVTNAEFSRALGRALHRPAILPAPAFALKLMLGEMATPLLLEGVRAVPARALAGGFHFRYPEIDQAFRGIFGD